MPYGDVLDRARRPARRRRSCQLTIPEGLSRREIAPLVGRAGRARRLPARRARGTSLIDVPRLRRCTATAESLEGFLFPATYELRARRAAPRAGATGSSRPSSRTSRGVDLSYARSKNLTAFDVVTIASMVEREAQVARERPLVAAVIYNRLQGRPAARHRRHDPLRDRQLDAAADAERAGDRLALQHAHAAPGLPPGPIGNPGLASLRGRGPPGARRLPLLRGEAGHLRRARLLVDVRASSSATSSATTRRATRRAASRPTNC